MELEVVIGLEIHAQVSTKTKLFSPSDNDAFGADPNTRVNEIDMGFPGTLPVLNKTAVHKAVRGAAAMGCEIQKFSKFDRKNYFYPDLPFGYQISQFDQPFSLAGKVDFYDGEGTRKTIRITRVHLENDAGKLVHVKDGSLCDYNRAGTPLVEIVTEPDLRSAEDAQAFAKEVQKILRFSNASDADMEKGMMRFDASISMRPVGEDKLYPRVEIKNLNSFTSLQKALKYEIARQKKIWEAGEPPNRQMTVGWVDETEKTQILRDKEDAHDYRYFPEPDLPPLVFTDEDIAEILIDMPELPIDLYDKYRKDYQLSDAESLKLSESPELSGFLNETIAAGAKPKKAAGMILSVILAVTDWKQSKITPQIIADALGLQADNKISSSGAKEIVLKAMETGQSAEDLMIELGLEQVSDTGELESWVKQVIEANPQSVEDYKAGKDKAISFLMGQVMKISRGAANPPMVMEMLKKELV